MEKSCFVFACLVFLCLQVPANAAGHFRLAGILQNNMVIQQGRPFTLWGNAPAGDVITIQTDWNNKLVTAKAGEQAKWIGTVTVPKAIPGKFNTHTITVIHNNDTVRLSNLLIGDVWVAGGQSNMEMAFLTWNKVKNYAAEIAAADYPHIRLLQVQHKASTVPQDEAKGTWQVCTPKSVTDFSALAYFFGREIYKHQNIPIGLVHTSWGGTVAQAWTSGPSLSKMPHFAALLAKDRLLPAIDSTNQALEQANRPSVAFNGMIHPFLKLSIRGFIWYQGESNSNKAYQYRELFPLMINDWRRNWNLGDLPFYFVQLANLKFGAVNDVPKESHWAELREAQLMATTLSNTGMAITIDIGDPDDIHYANKQEAGRRLALVALAKTYGQKIAYSGPQYRSVQIKGSTAQLSFDYTGKGLKGTGNKLKGFAIAAADKHFYWADATITGDKVLVSSPDVKEPVAVRYAWANNPDCSLYNKDGLPASPFRTDDWPGITFGLD